LSITRLESYTNEVVQGAPSAHAQAPADARRVRVVWDATLGLCAAGYLALVLFDDVESPLFSIALLFLVAHALIQPRRKV
jgi:hypothetical protein